MAARKGPLTESKLSEMRRRIQSTLLLKKLEDHALGLGDMTSSQITAAQVLLKKTMPDLQAIQHSGDEDNPVRAVSRIELVPMTANDSKD